MKELAVAVVFLVVVYVGMQLIAAASMASIGLVF